MSKPRRKSTVCYNCGTQLLNNENYCPNCGQENHSKQASTLLLLKDFFDTYLSFDSKLFITIRPLLFSPGVLTRDYLDGKRVRFVPPIRLFIFLSFVYFGITFLTGDGEINIVVDNSDDGRSSAFIDLFRQNINLLFIIFAPVHALLLMLLFRSKKRRFYVNFFVFTLHLFSFIFLLGIIINLFTLPFKSIAESNEVVRNILVAIEICIALYVLYYSIKSLMVAFEKRYTILRFIGMLVLSVVFFVLTFWAFIVVLIRIAPFDGSVQV